MFDDVGCEILVTANWVRNARRQLHAKTLPEAEARAIQFHQISLA